jgi:hypothetical protein
MDDEIVLLAASEADDEVRHGMTSTIFTHGEFGTDLRH